MSNVVVVDSHPQTAKTLDAAAGDAFEVIACSTARAGLNACCAIEPACLVTALHLPDHDGLWLADALRAQPTAVAALPIVMVADEDEETRVRALKTGVDVFVNRVSASIELVAQVRAIIAMAARLRDRRSAMPSSIPDENAALRGDLDRMPIATVLGALELDRRSGEIWIRAARGSIARKLVLVVASGALVGGQLDGQHMSPLEALRAALEWDGRRFEFLPGPKRTAPPSSEPLGKMMFQVMRAMDEKPAPRMSARSGTRMITERAPGKQLVEEVVRANDPRREADSDRPTIPFVSRRR